MVIDSDTFLFPLDFVDCIAQCSIEELRTDHISLTYSSFDINRNPRAIDQDECRTRLVEASEHFDQSGVDSHLRQSVLRRLPADCIEGFLRINEAQTQFEIVFSALLNDLFDRVQVIHRRIAFPEARLPFICLLI